MPNNPYSPEAIQKRLSAKSTSSLFDMITTKNQDLDEEPRKSDQERDITESENLIVKEIKQAKSATPQISENELNRRRSQSPPKVLKDVPAEEVLQYKRYENPKNNKLT